LFRPYVPPRDAKTVGFAVPNRGVLFNMIHIESHENLIMVFSEPLAIVLIGFVWSGEAKLSEALTREWIRTLNI